jgi:uncharacterized Zn-binding protein involved in type VI secretion
MAGEIIRKGDPTSHGGVVLEGSTTDICMGQPIAYIGHKVQCPKCKGIFPIAEGVLTTILYGRGVAVAGMKTACGAVLIPTQFTDTVEWSSGDTGAGSSKGATSAQILRTAAGAAASVLANLPDDSPDEQIRVVDHKTGEPIPELAYYIEAPNGSIYAGLTDEDGLCERVATYQPEELSVCFGEDAEKKMQGA